MGEEFKDNSAVDVVEIENTKFGFLNWLGIAWAFYWRTYLLTVVFAVLFLVLLKYTFFLLSAFLPSNPTLPVVFDVLKWFLAGLACYFASGITVRWIITLKNRNFLLQLTDKAEKEVPVLEVKKSIWFKLGWSFFWRQLILTVLLGVAVIGIFVLFNYIGTSMQSGLKTVIRFVLQMFSIFLALIAMLLNVKWFLKSKHKYYDLNIIQSNYSILKRNIGLFFLFVVSVIYAYSMVFTPLNGIVLRLINRKKIRDVEVIHKRNITKKGLDKTFVEKFLYIMKTEKKLILKWGDLGKKKTKNNDKQVTEGLINIINKLENLNNELELLKAPEGLQGFEKEREKYCSAYHKYLDVCRRLSESDNLKRDDNIIMKDIPDIEKDMSRSGKKMTEIVTSYIWSAINTDFLAKGKKYGK